MFTHLKNLYESELYSTVNQIATVILSDRSSLQADQYFLTLCYHGISLYEERLHRRAEETLKNALLARKTFMKVKPNISSYDSSVNLFSEVEIRFKLAQCYQATKQIPEAIATLQIISIKNRPAKVNMLLFKLLQISGCDKTAIGPLKALLKECPLNLEAIAGLLALGVKAIEIHLWIGDSLSPQIKEWLNHFIDGHSKMHNCQFLAAIESLKAIESNNETILVLIGQCYYYVGNSEAAVNYLTRAYQINNYLTDGLMALAAIYANLNRLDDLEKLTPPNLALTDNTPEYWFILAQYLYCQGKYDKAAYFAQKSFHLKPNNTEATILKVKVFIHCKKYKEALSLLRVLEEVIDHLSRASDYSGFGIRCHVATLPALRKNVRALFSDAGKGATCVIYASYRFEIYELFVDAYLATNRFREAQEISRRLFKQQGSHLIARSYVLAAKTYFSQVDPLIKIKSKPLLETALEKDPYCLPAVFMMVDLLLELNDSAAAVKLIKKQCTIKPNSKLYSILGDILSKEKNQMKAVENYTIAIKMDPMNRRANTGLMALGQSSQPVEDPEHCRTYEFEEMLEVPANSGEAESESDAPWSDFEIETR